MTSKLRTQSELSMIMTRVAVKKRREARRGGAAVELAGVLPILIFTTMAAIDFARVAYVQVTLQNCARNGALYEFYTKAGFALPSTWTTLGTAVNADVPSGMTVSASATSPASSTNNTVTVTVTTTFNLLTLGAQSNLPSIPGSLTLSQSATMPYPAGASAVP